jgi:hypothetical protein
MRKGVVKEEKGKTGLQVTSINKKKEYIVTFDGSEETISGGQLTCK